MLALSNQTSFYVLVSTVFIASITGSLHCVSMCGPLITSFIPESEPIKLIKYHLGRLIIYTCMGALSGLIGSTILNEKLIGVVSKFAWLPFCFFIFVTSINTLRGKASHFTLPQSIARFFKVPNPSPNQTFALGLLTGLLPCGWLHTFVIASSVTQDTFKGALVMLIFWIGTLPGLSSLHYVFHKLSPGLKKTFPKITAIILMYLGVQIVFEKTFSKYSNHSNSLHTHDASCN